LPRGRQPRPRPPPRPAPPSSQPTRDKGPSHDQIGNPMPHVSQSVRSGLGKQAEADAEGPQEQDTPAHEAQLTRPERASPDRSALLINPRAGAQASRGP